jgi:hypothetical protein
VTVVTDRVLFDIGEADLRPEGREVLDHLAPALGRLPNNISVPVQLGALDGAGHHGPAGADRAGRPRSPTPAGGRVRRSATRGRERHRRGPGRQPAGGDRRAVGGG